MKRIVFSLVMSLALAAALYGQKHPLVEELEARRTNILQQISESESLLQATNQDMSGHLIKLSALSGQIDDRKRYIQRMTNDLQAIDKELNHLEADLVKLEAQLAERKGKYATSVQYMYKNKSIEEKLLFIFSAKSLTQTYRRMRYVNEYAAYQRMQGEGIAGKQNEIKGKKDELGQTRAGKEKLLKEREAQQEQLLVQEHQLQKLVSQLQQRRWEIQQEITRKRKEAEQLNAQIDNFINQEIEKTMADARTEAKSDSTDTEPETAGTDEEAPDPSVVTPMGSFVMSKADRQLSGSFLSNRGRLPVPVTGPYAIVSRFGQYSVEGLRFVKLENKGIDIQGRPGANARAVFDGEVSAVFRFQGNGLVNVLIRHGNYISVYCNLTSASVARGDRVKTNQAIGSIFSDPLDNNRTVLHFQLRREREQLNPEPWLDR